MSDMSPKHQKLSIPYSDDPVDLIAACRDAAIKAKVSMDWYIEFLEKATSGGYTTFIETIETYFNVDRPPL